MKTKHQWKSGNKVDNIMNVLLIVLALGLLGVGAMEIESDAVHVASSAEQSA
jgi:hypothetical protein